jgi:hypothetical protein
METIMYLSQWSEGRWRISAQGNFHQFIDGFNIAVIEDHNEPGKWNWRIADPQGRQTWSYQKYSSPEEAKRAAIEEYEKMVRS